MKRLGVFVLSMLALIATGTGLADGHGSDAASQQQSAPAAPGFEVQWEGKLMRVHREGDASPQVGLAPLATRKGAFAIGPLAGLRGEITVIDGIAHLSRVRAGHPEIQQSWEADAPFLVYGHVSAWQNVDMPPTVTNPEALEAYLPVAARRLGIDPEAPFPFKLHVPSGRMTYHIMHNTDGGDTITRPHQELMAHFEIDARAATLIGVYSTAHAGVFTHHGESTHIHVVSDDGRDAGHLDGADFGEGAKLYLPVP
jgi:acetolactate decarboxylase